MKHLIFIVVLFFLYACREKEENLCETNILVGTPCTRKEKECTFQGLYRCEKQAITPVCRSSESPLSEDICGNQKDDDCDGQIDEGCRWDVRLQGAGAEKAKAYVAEDGSSFLWGHTLAQVRVEEDTFSNVFWLIKWSPSGKKLWLFTSPLEQTGKFFVSDLLVTPQQEVILLGSFFGKITFGPKTYTLPSFAVGLIKLNSLGQFERFQYAESLQGQSTGDRLHFSSLDGTILFTGVFKKNMSFQGMQLHGKEEDSLFLGRMALDGKIQHLSLLETLQPEVDFMGSAIQLSPQTLTVFYRSISLLPPKSTLHSIELSKQGEVGKTREWDFPDGCAPLPYPKEGLLFSCRLSENGLHLFGQTFPAPTLLPSGHDQSDLLLLYADREGRLLWSKRFDCDWRDELLSILPEPTGELSFTAEGQCEKKRLSFGGLPFSWEPEHPQQRIFSYIIAATLGKDGTYKNLLDLRPLQRSLAQKYDFRFLEPLFFTTRKNSSFFLFQGLGASLDLVWGRF